MSENYIVINGKRAELTEEQLKQLGIEVNKRPFERQPKKQPFYFITNKAKVEYGVEVCDFHCNRLFEVANYCTDKGIMEQRALHEVLNRLLWRYSMEHGGSEIDNRHYAIIRASNGCYGAYITGGIMLGVVQFIDISVAENAIKEIVEPFVKAHPEFKW